MVKKHRRRTSGFSVGLALEFLLLLPAAGVWANGQAETPPSLKLADRPRQYLAPGNPDATLKALVVPFAELAAASRGRALQAWTFSVFDSSGHLVFEDSGKQPKTRDFLGNLLNVGPLPQVEIPAQLVWDGTFRIAGDSRNGQLVPDGQYTYQVAVVDSAGQRAQTPPFNATVRNARIVIGDIKVTPTIFSPGGKRPTVAVAQTGSRESRWEGRFADASGKVVRRLVWSNPKELGTEDVSPPAFSWDGRDDSGQVVPDGSYSYTLVGTNRVGATASRDFAGPIVVSDRMGVVNLTSDVPFFSPKADGAPTVITFRPDVGSSIGLTDWKLVVSEPNHPDVALWVAGDEGSVPAQIPFDGKNNAGINLPEGNYLAVLSANYDNGNTAASAPLSFRLLLEPPRATLSASALVFGGSGRAGITVNLKAAKGVNWNLDVLSPKGQVLRSYPLGDTGDATLEFQGMDEAGKPFPDGPLILKATGRNQAGIPGSASLTVRKDSRSMGVGLDLSRNVVVPNRGPAGTVRITPVFNVVDSIEKTVLTVREPSGTKVASKQADAILTFWDWTGLGPDGNPVPDGRYRLTLEVTYANGTVSRASTDLTVDSKALDDTAPQADLHLSSLVFAPENVDGPQTLSVDLKAQAGASPLAKWRLSFLDPRGKPFRQFAGSGVPPAQVIWDGKSDSGDNVESGEQYQVAFEVEDTAGRTAKKTDRVTVDILVDRLPDGRYRIVISSIQFAGYSYNVFDVPQPLLTKNLFVLRRLASVLNRLPGYKIRLEGYAVSEFSGDPKNAEKEQTQQLIPLSLARAKEVETALVLLGVDEPRFTVVGNGALNPLVPNSDLENRWKNRRVEFYLEKMK